VPEGSFACEARAWGSEGEGAELSFGEVTTPPWNGNGACVRTLRADSLPARDWGQTIDAPSAGDYRFGASVFAPDLGSGEEALAEIVLIQRDAEGRALSTERLPIRVIGRFRTFEAAVAVQPQATEIRLSIRPLTIGAELAVTGAFLVSRLRTR